MVHDILGWCSCGAAPCISLFLDHFLNVYFASWFFSCSHSSGLAFRNASSVSTLLCLLMLLIFSLPFVADIPLQWLHFFSSFIYLLSFLFVAFCLSPLRIRISQSSLICLCFLIYDNDMFFAFYLFDFIHSLRRSWLRPILLIFLFGDTVFLFVFCLFPHLSCVF